MVRRYTTTDIRMRKKPHITYVPLDDYQRLATLARELVVEMGTALPDYFRMRELGRAILQELGEGSCLPK